MNKYQSTLRFSQRANQYNLYRPKYPQELISYLQKSINLNNSFNIADIGLSPLFHIIIPIPWI